MEQDPLEIVERWYSRFDTYEKYSPNEVAAFIAAAALLEVGQSLRAIALAITVKVVK